MYTWLCHASTSSCLFSSAAWNTSDSEIVVNIFRENFVCSNGLFDCTTFRKILYRQKLVSDTNAGWVINLLNQIEQKSEQCSFLISPYM